MFYFYLLISEPNSMSTLLPGQCYFSFGSVITRHWWLIQYDTISDIFQCMKFQSSMKALLDFSPLNTSKHVKIGLNNVGLINFFVTLKNIALKCFPDRIISWTIVWTLHSTWWLQNLKCVISFLRKWPY